MNAVQQCWADFLEEVFAKPGMLWYDEDEDETSPTLTLIRGGRYGEDNA